MIPIYTISSALVFISNFSVALLVLLKGKKNRVTLTCSFFLFTVSLWGGGAVLSAIFNNYDQSYVIWQYTNLTNIWGPITHHHFTLAICNLKKRLQLIILYSIGIIVSFINLFYPQYYLGDISKHFDGFYFPTFSLHQNPLYLIYYIVMFWGLLLYSFSLLYKESIIAVEKDRKNQLYFFMCGSIISWLGAHGDFPAVFGFQIYPFSNFLIAVLPIFIGLGIIRYQFLDITVVIKKSIVYSILLAFLSVIYLFTVVTIETYLQTFLGYKSKFISILMIFALGFVFVPLRNFIQNIVDKYFFKGTTIQLAEQNEMLLKEVSEKERFKKVATLASGMAHEIKNPLTAIKTFTEYLEKHKNDPDFYTKFSKIVGKEVDRIDDLVHQLLEFSKPFPVELKQCDMVKLVDDTLAFLDSQFLKNNITVHKVYDASTPILVTMDTVQIRQVILNIFINAIEAMDDTKGPSEPGRSPSEESQDSSLRPADSVQNDKIKTLTVTIAQIKNHVIFSTTDTGSGIAKEDIKHIFEPFFTKKDNGTGLGLSISYGIIEKHKGKIEVKSAVGVGTEFRVKLPVERK